MAFFAMEAIRGGDFDDLLSSKVVSTPAGSANLFLDALKGVLAMNKAGFVHRDLKPANLMMVPGAGARLTDFGSSCCVDQKLCSGVSPRLQCGSTKFGVGNTPYYMSPQLYEDNPPHDSDDLYAMGLIAYQMYTNQGSEFFKWLYDNPQHIAGLMWRVLDHSSREKKIWNDPRLGDVSTWERRTPMRQFLLNLLDEDPSKRAKAVQSVTAFSRCEDLPWCMEWMSMKKHPAPLEDEGEHKAIQDATITKALTQKSISFRTYLSLSMLESVGPENVPTGNGFGDFKK